MTYPFIYFLVDFFVMKWIVLILGGILIRCGIRNIYYGRQAFSWPSVAGKLLICSLESKKNRYGTSWKMKVLYSYSVEGCTFQCDRISFDYAGNNVQSYHKAIYNKLQRPTAQIMVRYQPSNPRRATLVPGIGRETSFLTTYGIWFFLLGLLMFYPSLLKCGSIWLFVFFLIPVALFMTGLYYHLFGTDSKLLSRIQIVMPRRSSSSMLK